MGSNLFGPELGTTAPQKFVDLLKFNGSPEIHTFLVNFWPCKICLVPHVPFKILTLMAQTLIQICLPRTLSVIMFSVDDYVI